MHNTPVAMPYPYGHSDLGPDDKNLWEKLHSHVCQEMLNKEIQEMLYGPDFTLEDYFKGLQKFHPVEDEVKHVKSAQVGGTHYQNGALQPWDIFLAWKLDPWAANVVKYILRFPFKNGIEDLRKARHYIDFLISHYDEVKEKYYTKDKK